MQSWKARLGVMLAMLAMLLMVSVPAAVADEEIVFTVEDIECDLWVEGDNLLCTGEVEVEDDLALSGFDDIGDFDFEDCDGDDDGFCDDIEGFDIGDFDFEDCDHDWDGDCDEEDEDEEDEDEDCDHDWDGDCDEEDEDD